MGRVTIDFSSKSGGESGSESSGGSSDAGTSVEPELKVTRKQRGRSPGQDPAEVLRRLPAVAKRVSGTGGNGNGNGNRNGSDHSHPTPRLLSTTSPPPLDMPVAGLDVYIDPDYIEHDRRKRYRASDFSVALKNDNDHGPDKMLCYFHPILHSAIVDMVECGEFPIRSTNALVNTLVLDGMRKLHYIRQRLEAGDERASEPNWIAILESISADQFQVEQLLAFQERLQRTDLIVRQLSKLGEFGERQAAKHVANLMNKAKKMASTEWGEWFREQIDSRWGGLVEKYRRRVRVVRGE